MESSKSEKCKTNKNSETDKLSKFSNNFESLKPKSTEDYRNTFKMEVVHTVRPALLGVTSVSVKVSKHQSLCKVSKSSV